MKRSILSSAIIAIAFITTFSSCDYVTEPIQPGAIIFNGRKTLIEDYTGAKCTNCPKAARLAEDLGDQYGDDIVVVSIHAGFFAKPQTSGNYLSDMRTDAGTAYDTYFGISALGNPNGLINRIDYSSSATDHVKSYSNWPTLVKKQLAKPKTADLIITNTFNASNNTLTCNVKSTFLYDTLTGGPYKLVVVTTQDSVVANQLDGGVFIPDYVNHNVLRDNLNGTWGENLFPGKVTANVIISKNYTYTFPATYPIAGGPSSTPCFVRNCSIVAFIYNDATKEVIQVEKKKVN
jgi:hypothetical protein